MRGRDGSKAYTTGAASTAGRWHRLLPSWWWWSMLMQELAAFQNPPRIWPLTGVPPKHLELEGISRRLLHRRWPIACLHVPVLRTRRDERRQNPGGKDLRIHSNHCRARSGSRSSSSQPCKCTIDVGGVVVLWDIFQPTWWPQGSGGRQTWCWPRAVLRVSNTLVVHVHARRTSTWVPGHPAFLHHQRK